MCDKNPQKKTSSGKFQALCGGCDQRRFNIANNKYRDPYRKYKLNKCERCGFIPEHKCQMDIHHIDGKHHNNDPNNLKTLCANCHRLEHKKTP